MIKKISHIGIVVRKIDPMLSILERAFGAREILRKEFSEHNQVITTTAETGLAADFLKERGEGIHHIAFEGNKREPNNLFPEEFIQRTLSAFHTTFKEEGG
jgi:catechol 2,3-dioxygenase-like lactoylglutathione lyase family enzyme